MKKKKNIPKMENNTIHGPALIRKVNRLQNTGVKETVTVDIKIAKLEKKIVKLMADGLTVDEIAKELDLNARTLERKVSDLRKLCKCVNLPHLVGFFFRNNLIK